ncbi:uncharacterized protein [Lepeophtheirus salmonis]
MDIIQPEPEDESGQRYAWEVITWLVVALTIILNLALILILLLRRNISSAVNKAILAIAILDLFYAMLVSPFFVENYINFYWNQSLSYCQFYIYYFTFHDMIIPGLLVLICAYVSLKYAGVMDNYKYKKIIYMVSIGLAVLISLLFAIPATVYSDIYKDDAPGALYKQECRTYDSFTMVVSYYMSTSLLFSFSMSFLFSLCIMGSPFLREIYDREEYSQRWRLMLTLSVVNIFYIITGFLLNFKEISRMLYGCCDVEEPYTGVNTLTYDVWSFVFAAMEPLLRPLTLFIFYFKYILTDYSAY